MTETHIPDSVDTVWSKIHKIRFAMLTTVDADGRLSSRPMTTVQKEFDGTFWFFASADSQQARDLASGAEVNVAYSDPDADRYVSIKGRGTVTRDRAKIAELWSPMTKAWFPGGQDDPQVVLLQVEASEAEFWDVKESKATQLIKMLKASATGTRPHLGEHDKVSI